MCRPSASSAIDPNSAPAAISTTIIVAVIVLVGIALMALSLLVIPLGTSAVLMAILVVPWALGCFSSNSAQQARLVAVAPPLAAASVALNSSAIYAGQAIGAALGGWMIARGGMDALHWVGFAGLVAAMAASAMATP